jgi:tripartite-type tricarboxylate transporter receptor subunit TctC
MLGLIAIAASGFGRLALASASTYPTRPLHIIVPNPAGGAADFLARLLTVPLGEALGQPVIVDLKPGAAGKLALDLAARSPPDGYTLFMANNGTSAILASVDGTGEQGHAFAPVCKLASVPLVIAVTPSLPVTTLPELIDRARGAPGVLTYASGGIGSTSHLAAELLSRRAGIKLLQIPYSGTAAGVKDVVSGEIPLIFANLATVTAFVQGGQLRALAVTSKRRVATLPGVPTVAEAGFPGFDVATWQGVLVPAGTPGEIIVRLHGELTRIVGDAQVRERLEAMGMEAIGGTPAQFAADIKADRAHWATVIQGAGIPTQ